MNTRRIIFISLFVLSVLVVIAAIYFVFFRSVSTPGPNTNQNTNGGTLPSTNVNVDSSTAVNGNIPVSGSNTNGTLSNTNASAVADGGVTTVNVLVPSNASDAIVSPIDNAIRYYNTAEDVFYETRQDGTGTRKLADQLFPDAENITWSNDANKAVIEFPDETAIVYDFNAKKQYTLPADTDDYSFNLEASQLAYKYVPESVEERYIVTANLDGSGIKFIEAIGDEAANVDVNWSPKGDVVATFRNSVDSASQEIFFVGLNKENFKSATTLGRGFTGKWSASGEQMVYSVYSAETNYNPRLYIMLASGDTIGSGRTDLGLETWPDKCTFSGATLYCAEPTFMSPGTGLYPDQAASSSDNFYQIDTLTGTVRLLAEPNISVNATNLYVSPDGDRLFFTNSRTGALQSILLS